MTPTKQTKAAALKRAQQRQAAKLKAAPPPATVEAKPKPFSGDSQLIEEHHLKTHLQKIKSYERNKINSGQDCVS